MWLGNIGDIVITNIRQQNTPRVQATWIGVHRLVWNHACLDLSDVQVYLVLHSVIKREVDIREASTKSRFVIAGVMNPIKIIFCVTRIVSRVIMVLGRCVIQGQARVSRKRCSIDTIAALIHTVKVIARIS
jgi:hypothetical protein